MSEFRQPWRPLKLDGRRARLQILDPATAFEWEPMLITALGDVMSLTVAAPDLVVGAIVRTSAGRKGLAAGLQATLRDPVMGPRMAADMLRSIGGILSNALSTLHLDPALAVRAFRSFVLGRLEVNGCVIETTEDWADLGLRPSSKWVALDAQVKQTFGPLWTRSPYRLRSQGKTYGVPEPTGVPIAVRWADNLARNGSARSSQEILREWTPVQMIEVVENSAYQAEIERRANEAARNGER